MGILHPQWDYEKKNTDTFCISVYIGLLVYEEDDDVDMVLCEMCNV